MSPLDDTFLSGATDDTVRFWDMRVGYSVVSRISQSWHSRPFGAHEKAVRQGMLNIAGRPCVAYDPTGAIFCVALNLRATVLFYDIKSFDQAPFMSVNIDDAVLSKISYPPRMPVFTSLTFSNDGGFLLLGTAGDVHYVIDAYNGSVLARLQCRYTSSDSHFMQCG
jgi:COMPASS component SWD2